MESYQIIRFYWDESHPDHRKVVKRGLSLEEAQAHCQRDDTHEMDPKTGLAVWFDGYEEER